MQIVKYSTSFLKVKSYVQSLGFQSLNTVKKTQQ